jgi:hypothetical protein
MRYRGTEDKKEIQRQLKIFIMLIQKEFQIRGVFEFFHAHRKFPEYTRGYHLRMSHEEYIEVVRFTGAGHARVWKLTEKAIRLIEGKSECPT